MKNSGASLGGHPSSSLHEGSAFTRKRYQDVTGSFHDSQGSRNAFRAESATYDFLYNRDKARNYRPSSESTAAVQGLHIIELTTPVPESLRRFWCRISGRLTIHDFREMRA